MYVYGLYIRIYKYTHINTINQNYIQGNTIMQRLKVILKTKMITLNNNI